MESEPTIICIWYGVMNSSLSLKKDPMVPVLSICVHGEANAFVVKQMCLSSSKFVCGLEHVSVVKTT